MPDPFEQLSLNELRQRGSAKWKLYPPDVLPMWVAEMDVMPVPAVSEVLSHALAIGDTGYAMGQHYQDAFGRFAGRHWNWEPDMEAAMVVADVMTGIQESLLATTAPGASVVIPTPVYPPFLSVVRDVGRRVVEVPLRTTADGSLRLDMLALADRMRANAGTRAGLLLCSPQNPTGTVHTRTELCQIASLAEETGTTVIVDEIHAPLTCQPDRFVPYLSLPGTESAILVTSASKAFNLAALKAAIVVPGNQARERAKFGEHVRYGASYYGVLAHVAALEHGDHWLGKVLANISSNRQFLHAEIHRQQVAAACIPGEATYLCWVDGRGLGLGADPAAPLRTVGRVAFNSGPHFGSGGSGHFRVNVAASKELIAEAVRRISVTATASPTSDWARQT